MTSPKSKSKRGRGDFRAARLIVAQFRAYSQGSYVSMCSPRAVSYDLIRDVRVALCARARHWVKMDYFCLLTLRLECIAAWSSVARLIAARFRAYSQGLHVSMCSLCAVNYDLIRAVRVALRARARHWVKMENGDSLLRIVPET